MNNNALLYHDILSYADKKQLTAPGFTGNKQEVCSQIRTFKNNEFPKIYEAINRKYKFKHELLNDLSKIKAELEDQYKWNATTAKRDLDAFLFGFVKPTLKFILEFYPFTALESKALIETFKGYEDIRTILEEGLKKYVIDKIIDIGKTQIDPVKKSGKIIYDAISDIMEVEEGFKGFNDTLKKQISDLEMQIKSLNSAINEQLEEIKATNELGTFLDTYIEKNCTEPNSNLT